MRGTDSTFMERGGGWVLVQFVLMAAVVVLGVAFPGDWTDLPIILLGVVMFSLGGWAGIAGVAVLGRNRTPFPQPRVGSELVERGIYARIRHPLYTSVMLACVGWALIWQSWPALVVALALVPLLCAKAKAEERWLRKQFPGYRAYAERVPAFIPRLRRRAIDRT